jgi:hypothetical protein
MFWLSRHKHKLLMRVLEDLSPSFSKWPLGHILIVLMVRYDAAISKGKTGTQCFPEQCAYTESLACTAAGNASSAETGQF